MPERFMAETDESREQIENLKRAIRHRHPDWDEDRVTTEARAVWLDVYA